MRVTEIFHSLQGEGILSGTPSVFVRLAGCPLRCRWCDTAYAWDFSAGQAYHLGDLIEEVKRRSCGHVVLTGGEPLVGPDLAPRLGLVELTQSLRARGMHVTIETAGGLFVSDLACDLMSISPKLSNSISAKPAAVSGMPKGADLDVLRALIRAYPCQLKFVIDAVNDIAEVRDLVGRLPEVPVDRILLMPQARTIEELKAKGHIVAELCKQTGYRFGHRLHVLLWGDRRGV
jgi:7-carboxy-7-deazaguanine synthase